MDFRQDSTGKSVFLSVDNRGIPHNPLYKAFKDRARVAFGIGTYIANDTDAQPLNIVMKVTECNNGPVAKLSDVEGKNMCKDPAYIQYLKKTINWRLEHQEM